MPLSLNRRKYLMACSVAFFVASTAQANDTVTNPHRGPYTESIAGVSTWHVNPGYVALDPDDTTRLMEKMQNPGVTNMWMYAPEKFDSWFAVARYEQTGHVSDDENIDAGAILEQMKQGTAAVNEERRKRGWAEVQLLGWQVAPHYEADTKRLSWATLNESNGVKGVNYTTKILGRAGVTTVTLVTDPAGLDAAVQELKQQLDGFSFNPDQTYAEFRPGDKIAEYGLTGLIIGGAAAAAIKTGAWKWALGLLAAGWKFVLAVVLAALAGIRSLFARRKA
jgi:uncharacterized membrane-anchored protein